VRPQLRAELELLLRGTREPLCIDTAQWDRVLRLARMTGLHGRLAAANEGNHSVPEPVRRHLVSASRIAAFNARMLLGELDALASVLRDAAFPVIALKGGAYALQGGRMANGRFASDVDLLVPNAHLRPVEQRLRAAGWVAAPLDAYDERYYRDWSHETPPMRFPGRVLELDLHHAITPVTGTLGFDARPLFDASVPVPGSAFRVLSPEDQVLHACVHCFHDGDLALRVREIVDIDALLRCFLRREGFAERLVARAGQLGLRRPLWYGLRFAGAWLGTPTAQGMLERIGSPGAISRRLMEWSAPHAMLPSDPDFPPPTAVRLARTAMLARYHRLRMPLPMLVPHLARKTALRMRARLLRPAEEPSRKGQP